MRIKLKEKRRCEEGEERVKSGFLFLPKKLGNEWRWLERAKWKQICMRLGDISPGACYSPGQTNLAWVSTEWA